MNFKPGTIYYFPKEEIKMELSEAIKVYCDARVAKELEKFSTLFNKIVQKGYTFNYQSPVTDEQYDEACAVMEKLDMALKGVEVTSGGTVSIPAQVLPDEDMEVERKHAEQLANDEKDGIVAEAVDEIEKYIMEHIPYLNHEWNKIPDVVKVNIKFKWCQIISTIVLGWKVSNGLYVSKQCAEAINEVIGYMEGHEGDIAYEIDDFGGLKDAFKVLIGREPK